MIPKTKHRKEAERLHIGMWHELMGQPKWDATIIELEKSLDEAYCRGYDDCKNGKQKHLFKIGQEK